MRSFLVVLAMIVSTNLMCSNAQTCDEVTGECANPDTNQEGGQKKKKGKTIVVPRYANTEGKPVEAVDDCYDRHENCKLYTEQGECTNNPGWMIIHCSLSCNACHLRSAKARCGRENLNTTDTGFLVPGKLQKMFERIENEMSAKYEVNVLMRDPWIITIDNFMTETETEALIEAVGDKWERSTDTGTSNKFGETGRVLSKTRTSSNSWCRESCENQPHVKNIIDKIVEVTTIPYRNYESFQVLQYELGQFYAPHHDTGPVQMDMTAGQRIVTFFLYLSDVEEGGETAFPNLKLTVKPKRGKALLWPGVMSDHPTSIDHRTLHEARPVIKGTKYAANSWIHQYDFKKANLWGCTGSFD